jgi:hypothetical protein
LLTPGRNTGLFISPSGISDPCGTVAGMFTPKGSISTKGETLQVSALPYRCDTRYNACRRNLITGLTSAASPRVHISSTCEVGQKLGISLPLLTCSPSAWPSRLLYRRGRKSRRDLWITLYILPVMWPDNALQFSPNLHNRTVRSNVHNRLVCFLLQRYF